TRLQTSADGTSLLNTGLSTLASAMAPVTARPPLTGVMSAVPPTVCWAGGAGVHAASANSATMSMITARANEPGRRCDIPGPPWKWSGGSIQTFQQAQLTALILPA